MLVGEIIIIPLQACSVYFSYSKCHLEYKHFLFDLQAVIGYFQLTKISHLRMPLIYQNTKESIASPKQVNKMFLVLS